MPTQRKYIIGYTDQYGEDRVIRRCFDYDVALRSLAASQRRRPMQVVRIWEEIEVGAGA